MKYILKLEQLGVLIFIIVLYSVLKLSWMWFAILFLSPDIFMLGYLFGAKVGGISYNFIHNYFTTIVLILIGYFLNIEWCLMIGFIFSAHIAFDRFLGFGLKKYDGFKSTHLGDL
ncbi:DUF4260 domain-containing protein [Empedobacter brevis]|uniref:DUF4260 domain-containing protein n=1 Tax=Empedobacter brevis TaxID=247 RepID=UPI0039AFDA01